MYGYLGHAILAKDLVCLRLELKIKKICLPLCFAKPIFLYIFCKKQGLYLEKRIKKTLFIFSNFPVRAENTLLNYYYYFNISHWGLDHHIWKKINHMSDIAYKVPSYSFKIFKRFFFTQASERILKKKKMFQSQFWC